MVKKISGTLEWAAKTANCCLGCEHNCIYCFGRYNAINRWKTVANREEWTNMTVIGNQVNKKYLKYNGVVMFPSTHDITPAVLVDCLKTIKNILSPGNNILIVSKPHLECVEKMCFELKKYKDNILFRFTIGALDNKILKFWEPGAPTFGERFNSLQHAFNAGFKTSISCEPMLDSNGILQLFDVLVPYVTDSIWIGKMNNIRQRVMVKGDKELEKHIKKIEQGQTNERIFAIYNELKDAPKIKWKESFKIVLGLELAEEAGLDE